MTLAGGIAAAALAAAFIPGVVGLGLAAVGGVIAVGIGGLSIRAGARNMDRARGLADDAELTAIHELAKKHGGVLTAAEVAAALQLTREAADDKLTSLIGDGTDVDLEIDDEGGVTYVFHALRTAAAQVRVDLAESDAAEHELEEADAVARKRGEA